MLEWLSERLLTVLQLTRMALVFTAISNSLCAFLLANRGAIAARDMALWTHWPALAAIALMSLGLYGFGMSLNDIIDHRRDRQLAAHRPLPSGRIQLGTAHGICMALGLLALAAGSYYAWLAPAGWRSFVLLVWTGFLIVFYDFAGKYLVATGLLTLGLIRFFHAVIPAPQLPVLWHPLLLFTHVTLVSAVAYAWEQKRPALTRLHRSGVAAGVIGIDAVAIAAVWYRAGTAPHGPLAPRPQLLLLAALAAAFIFAAWVIWRRADSARQAGQRLMLCGLLWLIAYDAAFAGVYVGWKYGLALFLLLPVSYLLVLTMRWWARLILISKEPTFRRLER